MLTLSLNQHHSSLEHAFSSFTNRWEVTRAPEWDRQWTHQYPAQSHTMGSKNNEDLMSCTPFPSFFQRNLTQNYLIQVNINSQKHSATRKLCSFWALVSECLGLVVSNFHRKISTFKKNENSLNCFLFTNIQNLFSLLQLEGTKHKWAAEHAQKCISVINRWVFTLHIDNNGL